MPKHRWPIGRILAGLAAVALAWVAVQVNKLTDTRRKFFEADAIRMKVDLSKTGRYAGPFNRPISCSEVLIFLKVAPLPVSTQPDEVFKDFLGQVTLTNRDGSTVESKHLTSKSFSFAKNPYRSISFSDVYLIHLFQSFNIEEDYGLKMTVDHPTTQLEGASQEIIGKYNGECLMLWPPDDFWHDCALGPALIAAVIVVVILIISVLPRRAGQPGQGASNGEAKSGVNHGDPPRDSRPLP